MPASLSETLGTAAPATARRFVEETAFERLARRALTLPGVLLAGALVVALLPLLLPLALLADLLRGRRLAATRLLLFGVVYAVSELVGLSLALLTWLASGFGSARSRLEAWSFGLQPLWAATLFRAAQRLFALEVVVRGESVLGGGPMLLLARHASIVDTLLPAVFVSARRGTRLRYVLKRELLFEPCLDVVGQRLPNVFVRRGSGQSETEIAAIRALAVGLGPGEGILIYPEGTRATPRKREAALARIERSGDGARLARAQQLRHLLPPRSGGPLALLDAAAHADVVFLAHTGFDGVVSLADVLAGRLVGRRIEIEFWRVPAAEIPEGRDARLAWLDAEWARLDAWVHERLAPGDEHPR